MHVQIHQSKYLLDNTNNILGAPTGGSFKRRSLKLRRPQKENKDTEPDCK